MSSFNRQPYQVNLPSSSDNKDYFFNHVNLKGKKIDSNFLTVDQETFEDCNNVYVNSDGLLRSRPSIKPSNKYNVKESYTLLDFYVIKDFIVYKILDGNDYKLLIFKDSLENALELFIEENSLITNIQGLLFIFSTTSLNVFDPDDGKIKDGVDFIYVPETKSISGESESDIESVNLLTNMEIYTYLYSETLGVPIGVYGKDVEVTINNVTYKITFEKHTEKTLTQKYTSVSNIYFSNNDLNNIHYRTCPRDGYDSFLMYSIDKGILLYSEDGKHIKYYNISVTSDPTNALVYPEVHLPEFSYDGNYVMFMDDGPMIMSIRPTEFDGELKYKYEKPTPIRSYLDNVDDYSVKMPHSWGFVNDVRGYILDRRDKSTYVLHVYYDSQYKEYVFSMYDNSAVNNGKSKIILTSENDFSLLAFDKYYIFSVITKEGTLERKYHKYYDLSEFSVDLKSDNSRICASSIIDNGTSISYYFHRLDNVSGEYVVREFHNRSSTGYGSAKLSSDLKFIATDQGVYSVDDFLFINYPDSPRAVLSYSNYAHFRIGITNNTLDIFTNKIESPITLKSLVGDKSYVNLFNSSSKVINFSDYIVSNDNKIYVSAVAGGEKFKLYFPKIRYHELDVNITGLQPVSSSELAIFTKDEVWYAVVSEGLYYYYKSKLQVGLRPGADIVTSYDGTNVIFPTDRGLVALSYQSLVASTDQALSFLSDSIFDEFKIFVEKPVKLVRYQYWIICYKKGNNTAYVLDIRNGSWWPVSSEIAPDKIFVVENEILLLSNGKLYSLNSRDDEYYDLDSTGRKSISWFIRSQKLHFGAINYTKHVTNLTLYSVLDNDVKTSMKMIIYNYRYHKKMTQADVQTLNYDIDVIRTFVKRVNYPKINEFQYELCHNDEQVNRVPLSITGITIKYNVTGQVR